MGFRHFILLLGCLANIVSYTDRSSLSLTLLEMEKTLDGFGPQQQGIALSAFFWGYILTQVVGWKIVRLYDASETPWLYPKAGGGSGVDAQGNVSDVDIEAPDLDAHPLFARATCREALLGPADGLFIPAGTWHHVRSLTPSVSISFWF